MRIFLLGSSSETLLPAFDSGGIKYINQVPPVGVVMASAGDTIQIIKDISDIIPWGTIAAVFIAWLKYHPKRKIIFTSKNHTVVHAEGLSVKQIEQLLPHCEHVMVVDTKKSKNKTA